MPRPENVTDEDIARWEEMRQKWEKERDDDDIESLPFRHIPKEFEKELYYSSCWLGEELEKLNCDENTIHRICFAVGQKQSHYQKSWEIVIADLERFKKTGEYDAPGEDLSKRMIYETFKNKSKEEIKDWICTNWNIPPDQLPGLMFRILVEGPPKLPENIA